MQRGFQAGRIKAIAGAVAIFLATAAIAQQQVGVFNVSPGSLADALKQLSAQAQVQIVVPPELVQGKSSLALDGHKSLKDALAQVLAGSGLDWVLVGDKVVIKRVGASPEAKASNVATAKRDELDTQTVTVTGTRLRMPVTASPMTVITAEDIKQQGLSTADDIVRSLPQNFGSVNAGSTLDSSQNPAGSQGQSAANLRGLGSENTLILVNGMRRAASVAFDNGTVSLNTIPVGAIERVEVITDGASAIYGSDAIAGVINFILKKNYSGGETSIRKEFGSNGGNMLALSQTGGHTWDSGNVTFGMRAAHTDPILSSNAGVTTYDLSSQGGADFRSGGQPGIVLDATGNLLGALPATDDGTHGIAGKLSPSNLVLFDPAKYGFDVGARQKQFSMNLNGEQDLSNTITAYGDFSYGNNYSEANGGVQLASVAAVPASNAYNDLGAPVYVSYGFGQEYADGALAGTWIKTSQRSIGTTLGLKVQLPHQWSSNLSANYAREVSTNYRLMIDPAILAAKLSGVDASGNPVPASEQLNLFGNGTAQSAAALEGLQSWTVPGFFDPGSVSSTRSLLLTGEGPVLKTTTGDVRLAAGGELRKEGYRFGQSTEDLGLLTSTPDRDVRALFAETGVPVIGEGNRLPGVYLVDVFAAARWEEYLTNGQFNGLDQPGETKTFRKISPKFGVNWFPVAELHVRSTYGKAFRAPNLKDLFQASIGPLQFLPITDPVTGVTSNPDIYFTGNPNLKPETSSNLTLGVDWTPSGALKGWANSITYSDIDFVDRFVNLGPIAIQTPDELFGIPGVVERDSSGAITRINVMPVNLSRVRSRSIDFSSNYSMPSVIGTWNLGLDGTYTLKLAQQITKGGDVRQLAGTVEGPERLRMNAHVGWATDAYSLRATVHHSVHYINDGDYTLTRSPEMVGSYTTFDLNGGWRSKDGWSIDAGSRNLFDKKPPFFAGYGVPYDTRRVDLRGRVLYVEVTKRY